LTEIIVGLGWAPNLTSSSSDFDLDASAFLIGPHGKVRDENDFVFYNNASGGQGLVKHSGDNLKGSGDGDDEQIRINLSAVPTYIEKIAFTITINDAQIKRQIYGDIKNSYVRILNASTHELLLNYELGQEFSIETAIVAAELYRHAGEWKFNAIASGFQGGLGALCHDFGLEVEEDQSPAGASRSSHENYGSAAVAYEQNSPQPYGQNNSPNSCHQGYSKLSNRSFYRS